MKAEKDYYQLLGLQRSASPEDIKKAYRLYAAKFHPDKHDGDLFFEERFKELKEAYETLSDDEARSRYDIRKFGRSRVIRRTRFDDNGTGAGRSRKIRMDISYLDIYLTLFYAINLVAWVVVRRSGTIGSSAGLILSLFCCVASTLLLWVFLRNVIDRLRNNSHPKNLTLVILFLLALFLGWVPLFSNWIS